MINKPWEYSDFWNNESEYLTWLRGQLRQIWSDYPVRVEFKEAQCVKVTPEMRERYGLHRQTKKAAQCVFCENWFAKSKLEVDHKVGESSLKSVLEVVSYLDHLQCSTDNMQLACKPCHKIKTYAERYSLSFEDARLEKEVILWLKQPIKEQVELLEMAGYNHEEISNAKKRRIAARELLRPAS